MKARDDQEEPPATTAGQPLFGKSRLKEDFQKSWDHLSEWPAQKHLNRWLWWASHSRPEPFQNLARMLREHLEGILAWTRRRVTHGAMEGTNNKVKLVSHRRFGFRNEDRYIEAIYHSCGNLPLPED